MRNVLSEAGQLVGGRYRLKHLAGAGGMAEVWRAELEGIEGFRRAVAVKRILKHLSISREHRQMFVQEATLTATLDHPNIVHVYDFGEDPAGLFLVLEWVEGLTMRDLIELMSGFGQTPSPALATAIGIEVLKALEAAHEHTVTMPDGAEQLAPIIHRDVSPSNILLAVNGVTKLADFGLARAMHTSISSMTPAGVVKGKLAYMAPEIFQGRPASVQSDVYSTGVVLWELLSCRRLFQGEGEVIEAIMKKSRPPSIAVHRPDLPPSLVTAVDRSLSADLSVRYASAAEFARALADVLRTMPERTDRSRLARELRSALAVSRKLEETKTRTPSARPPTPTPAPSKPPPPSGRPAPPALPTVREIPQEAHTAASIELELDAIIPMVETLPSALFELRPPTRDDGATAGERSLHARGPGEEPSLAEPLPLSKLGKPGPR